MKRTILPLIVFAALIAAFFVALQRDPGLIPSPLLAQPVPKFSVRLLDDDTKTLSHADFLGKPSLINVWGSWCANCGVEHPFLMRLARDKVIDIYGLNWNDERASALDWLQRLGDPYTASGFDVDGRAAIEFGVYGAPETFLVDAQGIIVHKHIGPLDQAIWQRDFVPRLQALAERQ